MDILITLYVIGFIISLYRSYLALVGFRHMKQQQLVDFFKEKPEVKRYLVLKVIFWPYYFVTDKSPLVRLSETFFKHYGDQGYKYYGTRGLQNFVKDLTQGKDRYKQYQIQHFVWELNSPVYPKEDGKKRYAEIILALHKDHFLFQATHTDKPFRSRGKISRFMLDECNKFPLSELEPCLKTYNVDEFENLRLPHI